MIQNELSWFLFLISLTHRSQSKGVNKIWETVKWNGDLTQPSFYTFRNAQYIITLSVIYSNYTFILIIY